MRSGARRGASKAGAEVVADLRTFLDGAGDAVWRIQRPLSVAGEIAGLLQRLSGWRPRPIVLVARPLRVDGTPCEIPVATNLFAGLPLTGAFPRIAPVVVATSEAPVQEVVRKARRADLGRLPILHLPAAGSAPRLTCAHLVTCDADTGRDSTVLQRCLVKGARTMASRLAAGVGGTVTRWWARGEDCPCALWIGHHPTVIAGAHAGHWETAGGMAGEPVRLVPTLSHGGLVKVPADAEIIIEGRIPRRVPSRAGLTVSIEVEALTMRRFPIYADFGTGGGGLPRRASIRPDERSLAVADAVVEEVPPRFARPSASRSS